MKKIIVLPFLMISIFLYSQTDTSKALSNWTRSISFSPNLSLETFRDFTSGSPINNFFSFPSVFFPFSNTRKLGLGLDFKEKYKLTERTNFVTGLSLDGIIFEWKDWIQGFIKSSNLIYISFGIPLKLETTIPINNKISFRFNFGVQFGIIPNANAIEIKGYDPSTGYSFKYELQEGSLMIYGTFGLGLNYKFNAKSNLFLGPQYYNALRSLEYYDVIISNGYDSGQAFHFIQYVKFISFDYRF